MSDGEYERALEYAKTAMDMMRRARIPPRPQCYEVWYTYASGVSERLNERLNALMQDGRSPTLEEVMDIYREFLSSSDLEHRLSAVSAEMNSKITAVNRIMSEALDTAAQYSGELESATGSLQVELDTDALRALASGLLSETRRMQETNRKLEGKLEESKQDISLLQKDLDDARRASLVDPLTKVANRKGFDDRLMQEVRAASEQNRALSLAIMDIDHFKRFNDTFGHQTGDQVLRLVAMTVKSSIKGSDLVARYGGEEFAAILPHTGLDGARAVAENIRKAVHAKQLLKRSTNENLGRLTISIGVAQWRSGEDASRLIERADECLYGAKRAGRNRVIAENDPGRFDEQVA